MATTQSNSGLTRQTYSRLVYGIVGIGVFGLLTGLVINQHLVGTVIYLLAAWIGGGIAFIAPIWSDRKLQDERDYELHNRASGLTIGVATVLGLGFIPALYVLDAGGYIVLTGAAGGVVLAVSALFLLYGVCFGIVKVRN
jgi:undecaprenyl pyrophosphate phosphatase UppP